METKKIAVPCDNGVLAQHFGHCSQFAFLDVNVEEKKIVATNFMTPPAHEPGVLPVWLKEQGADVVIAGGMGGGAVQLFAEKGIQVVMGAPSEAPEKIVTDWMENTLQTGDNTCSH